MFSWKSSANLKLVGIEGHSHESLREAVDRGAKFVIYSYNFSLVVMSFKRPSNVHFIQPDENRIFKGFPYTLISLAFGWWGIPWGVIYTIQTLHQNFTGGKDVTREILATIAPSEPGASPAGAPAPALPAAKPVSKRRLLVLAGGVAAAGLLVYVGSCFYLGQSLDVALVSGLSTSYQVELNGVSYQLKPGWPQLLELPEGDFSLRNAPGGPAEQTFAVHTDFFSRPFDRQVLIINPDRIAVVFREGITYHPTGSAADPHESSSLQLYTNRITQVLAKPDYFFTEFPATISMPSGSDAAQRTRLGSYSNLPLETRVSLLQERVGYEAARDYLSAFARFAPEDEALEKLAFTTLKPDDARKLFESQLDRRPLLVEWHRAYQHLMDTYFHEVDLLGAYQKRMEAAPDEGEMIYLYARLLVDPALSRPLFEKARRAPHPSVHAIYAQATDAFGDGHYAECLDLLNQAEQGGLHDMTLRLRKRDALLALGRMDEALAEVRRHPPGEPQVDEFADELSLLQAVKPDRAAGQKAINAYVAGLRRKYGESDYSNIQAYLEGHLLYALGDETGAAERLGKLKGAENAFEAAVGHRDHVAAAKAVAEIKQLPARYFWILSLTARDAGDHVAADQYYQKAVQALAGADRYSRTMAARLQTGGASDHEEIRHSVDYADELRIMYAALGAHFPGERERYFARARELDHDPAFPHLLLQTVYSLPAGKPL
jgi:hypothetical protein